MIQQQDIKDGVRVVLLVDLHNDCEFTARLGMKGAIRSLKHFPTYGVEFDSNPDCICVIGKIDDGQIVSIFDVCELDGNDGEAIAAAPAPSGDAPTQSLKDVAGDLLASTGRQTSEDLEWDDTPLFDTEKALLDFEEECSQRGAIPQWVDDDDDIQAGIPARIEQQMWDTARFLQETVSREDTLAEIAMETAQILASLDEEAHDDASHEGGDWTFDFDSVASLKKALKKANTVNEQLRTNEKVLLAVIDKQSAQIDRLRGGGNCVLTKKGRALLAQMNNEAVA